MNSISIIKIILLITAIGLTAIMFLWPSANDERVNLATPQVADQLKKTTVSDVGSTKMLFPRFSGEDAKNRRWELKAEEAVQKGLGEDGKIDLKKIEAVATTSSGHDLIFEAGEGNFSQISKTLVLKNGVKVSGHGYTLETAALTSNFDNNNVKGSSPVKIKGAGGELFAKEFEILHNGETVRLSGGVKGRFMPSKMQTPKPKAVSPSALIDEKKPEEVNDKTP